MTHLKLNDAETKLIEWQLGMSGDFFRLLINAAMRADKTNAAQLRLGFPDLMEAIHKYKNEEGYYQKLCEIWNNEHPNRQIF